MGSFLQNFLTAKPTATKKKVAYFYDSTSDPVYHSDSSARRDDGLDPHFPA
jgi:hypothetical protein